MSVRLPELLLPASRRAAGTYSLTIDTMHPLDQAAAEDVLGIARLLAVAGNRGAFPAPSTSPLASRFDLGNERLDGAERLVCTVTGENFDLYGFELLRNMGSRLARKSIDVRRFALSTSGTTGTTVQRKPVPTDENEFDAYPAVSPLIRFALEGEGGDVGKMRRCVVELSVIVDASHVSRVEAWVDPWFELLESGAFSMPVGPATETDCIRGGVALFDEQSIEITLNRFQASETAWHALINILDTCWASTPLISKLLVD